jgi:hypothetical protein
MPDATLRLLETLRAYGTSSDADRSALEAFARLIAAPAPCAADIIWFTSVASDAAFAGSSRTDGFRFAYEHALAANGGASRAPADQRTTGALALEGLLELPPRERAVLALSCLLGFTEGELAAIIDEPPAITRSILDAAVDRVRNAASSRSKRDGRAA